MSGTGHDVLPAKIALVFGICAGPTGKVERIALPSIKAFEPDARVIVRRGQRSIWRAYDSIRREAVDTADAAVVVFMHDDVELRGSISAALGQCFGDPTVGLVGAIGGCGQTFEWWCAPDRYGYAADLADVYDEGGGTHEVDGIDGLLMACAPDVLPAISIDGRGYPCWHGYDACLSAQVRQLGKRVLVTDLPLMHHNDHSKTDWASFEQARYAHYLRWRHDASMAQRLAWRRYRLQLQVRLRSRLGLRRHR